MTRPDTSDCQCDRYQHYVCTMCGRRGHWGHDWAWYGRIDDPPEAVTCSKECRDATQLRGAR